MSSAALRLDAETFDQPLIPAIAQDGSLFPVGKMRAHRRGMLHLAVSVFVFSGEELLIQRRSAGKYHCGLAWANTCCTHPNWGETEEEAATRRLREELGITLPFLLPLGTITYRAAVTSGLIEHERVQAFLGTADKRRLEIAADPEEVCETRWATPAVLRNEVRARPRDFAPWFRIYLARWAELRL